jgi:hypothetical protein
MERGLLWLPLLSIFIWLAWAGRNEYLKVEAYKLWAKDFERHKYDIYAVLGQQGNRLTWGKPTAKAPINLQTIVFADIQTIQLKIDGKYFENLSQDLPPSGKNILIELNSNLSIPFTDIAIAANWYRYLLNRGRADSAAV